VTHVKIVINMLCLYHISPPIVFDICMLGVAGVYTMMLKAD